MARHTRYQGFIVENDHVLLIQHREHATGRGYWVIPGGGLDGAETEEECVIREVREETNLEVEIVSLLFDEPGHQAACTAGVRHTSASPSVDMHHQALSQSLRLPKIMQFPMFDGLIFEKKRIGGMIC